MGKVFRCEGGVDESLNALGRSLPILVRATEVDNVGKCCARFVKVMKWTV
jgi:hypothetical protein